jgi:hypothetical protein
MAGSDRLHVPRGNLDCDEEDFEQASLDMLDAADRPTGACLT